MSANIWSHTTYYRDQLTRRARGEDPILVCETQLADILRPLTSPGMSLLDAGCATGYYYRTLKTLEVEYYGIDSCPEYITIGQQQMPDQGLSRQRLRQMSIEDLYGETYHIVVCFNTLLYCPNYHLPLERLADATEKYLVIRTLLGPKTRYRFEFDGYLDEGFNHLKAYFNIFSMDVVKLFLRRKGFTVEELVDRRTNDQPETVIGKVHPWRILLCTRTEVANV